MEYMTRRSFVEMATIAAGGVAFAGLPACSKDGGGPSTQAVRSADADTRGSGSATETSAPTSAAKPALGGSRVYFAHDIDGSALQAVFAAIGRGLGDGKVGVKLSSGEPGGNYYLQPTLIEPLVSSVSGTIVECNTAYGGSRSTIDEHYKVAADHGFTRIADFQIMDETGSLALPVEGGFHLAENLVGAAFADYDGFLVLSHFKGHSMAGFGGALKNISIGMASREGKLLIHSAGENRTSWQTASQNDFLESMADACQAVMAAQPNMLFVNAMNNLSVNCDCESNPAPPKMADIGVLASDDPVALDQACVDLVYASDDDSADLIERMESRNGVHVLEAADSLGVGSRTYELVEIDG